MQLIIVSGLIGSGKTTVSKLLKKKKFHYLNADGMAKDLLKTNKEIKEKLFNAFGKSISLGKNLSIKKIKEKLLVSKKNKIIIDRIIHPIFFSHVNSLLNKMRKSSVVFELPLIETSKNISRSFKILTVDCSFNNRLERSLKNKKISKLEFTKLNKMQSNRSFYINNSDFILSNNDTISTLKNKFEELYLRKLLIKMK